MFNIHVYRKAFRFAAVAHHTQKILGTTLPYLIHVDRVLGEVMVALDRNSKGMCPDFSMQCALLHDVLEDTDVTEECLEKNFGSDVTRGVKALTKDMSLPKEKRMLDSLSRILEQSSEVRLVKMADRIVNLQEPPSFWRNEKRRAYQEEAKMILEKLQGVHCFIEERLHKKIQEYSKFIEVR